MDSVSLAEPRRRQKWTLNPRGNLWANDESKFGQKLMEKMGWEKGKGLGANENGRVQHISLKLKDNNKGIGFEGHDDTWLEHQNDFQVPIIRFTFMTMTSFMSFGILNNSKVFYLECPGSSKYRAR